MTKKLLFLIFSLAVITVPLVIIYQSENILENGHRHKIKLRGYDPFDPFRGKYLRLNYDNMISGDETIREGEKAYITLKKDSDGFSEFDYAFHDEPSHTDYFEAEVLYAGGGMIEFKMDNITKYFINENKAKKAEYVIMDFTQNKPNDIYVAIRVYDGHCRLEDIFVEEKPLLEYIDTHYSD